MKNSTGNLLGAAVLCALVSGCAGTPAPELGDSYQLAQAPSYKTRTQLRAVQLRAERNWEQDDAVISSQIRSEFVRSLEVNGRDIHVDTYHGEVQLSGVAEAREEIGRAVKIALNTPGVRLVRNQIELQKQ